MLQNVSHKGLMKQLNDSFNTYKSLMKSAAKDKPINLSANSFQVDNNTDVLSQGSKETKDFLKTLQTLRESQHSPIRTSGTYHNTEIYISPCQRQNPHWRGLLHSKPKEHKQQPSNIQYSVKGSYLFTHIIACNLRINLKQYVAATLRLRFLFLLLPLLTPLPLPAFAGCRDEPSRSCEVICRPNWLKADNHNQYDAAHHLANAKANFSIDTVAVFSSPPSRPLPISLVAYNCTVRVLVLLPDNETYLTPLQSVIPILKVAEQHIRESGLLPPFIRFDWMPQDDMCDAAFATVKAMDGIVKDCAHVVFGPTCDYALAAVGRITKYFNSNGTPLITTGGSTFDFGRQKTTCVDEFYMMLRTGLISFEIISELTITVMKRYNWSRSILFYDRDGQQNVAGQHTCFLMMNSLGQQMRNNNMTFAQYPTAADSDSRREEMIREIGNKHSGK